jgi:hypothetical protein
MKRNIICWILVCLLAISMTAMTITMVAYAKSTPEDSEPTATFSEDYIPSDPTFPDSTEPEEVVVLESVVVERVEPTTYDDASTYLDIALQYQEAAEMVVSGLFILGYEENHPAMALAINDLEMATANVAYYQEEFNKWEEIHKWEIRAEEYPVATEVWLFLKEELGYSDAVCAGIIGNMMAECGGHTLNLQWNLYNASYHYGLCQWSSRYYPEMQGANLEEQLAFMAVSFPKVIDRYGYLYQSGMKHEQFKVMDDCGDAAIAFCVIYERPGSNQNYRRGLAEKAYNYFTN